MHTQEVISQTTYENDGAYKCEGAEDAEGLKVYWQEKYKSPSVRFVSLSSKDNVK